MEVKVGKMTAEAISNYTHPTARATAGTWREKLLSEALELTSNNRESVYGPPSENLKRIADLWSVVLGTEILPSQVAMCMIQVKLARLVQTPEHWDSWVDLAGYAAIGAEVTDRAAGI